MLARQVCFIEAVLQKGLEHVVPLEREADVEAGVDHLDVVVKDAERAHRLLVHGVQRDTDDVQDVSYLRDR